MKSLMTKVFGITKEPQRNPVSCEGRCPSGSGYALVEYFPDGSFRITGCC